MDANETMGQDSPLKQPDASSASAAPDAGDNEASSKMNARSRYEYKLQQIDGEVKRLQAQSASLNMARGFLFFGALILLGVGYFPADGMLLLVVPGWLMLAVFLVVITYHENVIQWLQDRKRSRGLFKQLLARLDRRWEDLPVYQPPENTQWFSADAQSVASDLDLFGSGSLYQLVSLAATQSGKDTLAKWIAEPALRDEAIGRHEAIKTLATFHDEREQFYATAKNVAGRSTSPANFLNWAIAPPWLDASRGWMFLLARVLLLATLIVWPLAIFSIVSLSVAIIVQLIVFASATLITIGFLGPVHDIFKSVATRRAEVDDYIHLFEAARWLPEDIKILQPLREKILHEEHGAIAGLSALGGLSYMTCLRHSPILFLPYLLLQLTVLWDIHVLSVLERWKARYGDYVEGWFDSLGQLESLLSLAALADEYPDWTSPNWTDSDVSASLSAQQMGHPLLPDDVRVNNSVHVGPAGSLLLVTGSNMSGKSTLLRSLGLNIKLAGLGSVVCAEAFTLPSCEVATSIRVHDSLSDGVSFYMAELRRLRQVVDRAREVQTQQDRVVFYLLDEILQGTNSRERQIAVATVLDHLVRMDAIGAISTHDLELADDTELSSIATVVHFREQIQTDANGKETMTFDYKMRDGVTPTTNAIRLLEMVGLGRK